MTDPHASCAAEIARLKARVSTLETALKPFAEIELRKFGGTEYRLVSTFGISADSVRRAAKALSSTPDPTP